MDVHILEMPLDLGASRHGSDMGPSAVRLAGIKQMIESLGHRTFEHTDIFRLEPQECLQAGNPRARYLGPIARACTALARQVEDVSEGGGFPLVIGGDHSVVLGSLAGASAAARRRGQRLGVLYIDAHGDFNTAETTPSGNVHGECLAASAGYGIPELTGLYFRGRKVDPRDILLVGCRDLDPGEKALMRSAGVGVATVSDIDRRGLPAVLGDVRGFLARMDRVHVSMDMDALDPMFAPGTGIPLAGGLTDREALLLMEEAAASGKVGSADIVEVNPVLDVRGRTAALAAALARRLLGGTLY